MPWYEGNIPALWEAALERKTGARISVEVVLDPDGQNVALNGDHDVATIDEVVQEREIDLDYGGRATVQDITITFNDPDDYFAASNLASPFHQAEGTLDRDHAAGATTIKLLSHDGVEFAADEILVISDGTNEEQVVIATFTADDGSTGYHTLTIDAPGLVNAFAAGVRIWSRPVVGRELLVSLSNITETTAEKFTVFKGRIVRAPELSVGQARITIADSRKLLLDTVIVGADSSADLKLMTIGQYGELISSIDWGGAFNKPPLAYTIESGSLPAGLLLDSATGVISGTPTTVESQALIIRVTNADGEYVSQQVSIESITRVNTEMDSALGMTDYTFTDMAELNETHDLTSGGEGYMRLAWAVADAGYESRWDAATGWYDDPDALTGTPISATLTSPGALTGDFCVLSRINAANYIDHGASSNYMAGIYVRRAMGSGADSGYTSDMYGFVLGFNIYKTQVCFYSVYADNRGGITTGLASDLVFRIRKIGTTYYFAYRTPAGSWVELGTQAASWTPGFVGIFQGRGYTADDPKAGSIDIDYLRVFIGALTVATTELPATIAGDAYSYILRATGGAGEYTWDVSVGSLPAGLSLDSVTGEISGTPTVNGSVTFTARVADGAGATATQSLTIDVSSDYQILPTILPWGYAGAAYSQTMRVYVGGALDRTQVVVGARCPLGQWRVKFTSSTAFEITSPGLGVFTGDIGAEFSVSGVITIPATAWTSGMAKDDEMTFITGKTWAEENPVQILYDILTIIAGLLPKQLHASSFFGDIALGMVNSHNTTTEEIEIGVSLPAIIKAGESMIFGTDSETVATGNAAASSFPPLVQITIAASAKDHTGKAAKWAERSEPDADWTFDAEYLYCQAAGILVSICMDRQMTIAQAIEAVAAHGQLFTFHDFGLEHVHSFRPRQQASTTELTDAELKTDISVETSEMVNEITVSYAYDYVAQQYQKTYTFPESDANNPSYLKHGARVAKSIYAPGFYSDELAASLTQRIYELYQNGLELARFNLDLRGMTFRMGERLDLDATDPDIEARFEVTGKRIRLIGGKNVELAGYNTQEMDKFALTDLALADVSCAW